MADPVHPLETNDAGNDPNEVENAWAKAIERRRREIREGEVELVDGDEFLRELRAWRPKKR